MDAEHGRANEASGASRSASETEEEADHCEGEIEVKIGDVVCLKSGGPEMTVTGYESLRDVPMVHLAWFNSYPGDPQTATLPKDAVMLVVETAA